MRLRGKKADPYELREIQILRSGLKQLEASSHTGNSKTKAYRKFNMLIEHITEFGQINNVLLKNAKSSIVSSAKCGAYIGNEPNLLESIRALINKI